MDEKTMKKKIRSKRKEEKKIRLSSYTWWFQKINGEFRIYLNPPPTLRKKSLTNSVGAG
jgi:hypothetical protein